jgi:rhamnulose-1-phosphate aldolase
MKGRTMRVLETGFVKDFIGLAAEGYRNNWHERNGGNLSIRLAAEEVKSVRNELRPAHDWETCGFRLSGLAGEYFLITGTGKYMRHVAAAPEENIGIIEIDETGERYRTVWGLSGNGRPTSELPTHLLNHESKKAATDGAHRVIYHFHPVNLIALTCVLPLKDAVFTRALWGMISECPVVFPAGVAVLEWMVPGGTDIARATADKMKTFDVVVWAHHGVFCSGPDCLSALGLAQTVEKAAEILVKVIAMRGAKTQGMTGQNLRDMDRVYGLHLPPEFLKDG